MTRGATYETYVEVVRATALALLCNIDGEEYWIPKSQIEDDGEIGPDASPGDEGLITMSEWIAREKELI